MGNAGIIQSNCGTPQIVSIAMLLSIIQEHGSSLPKPLGMLFSPEKRAVRKVSSVRFLLV